MQVGCIFEYQIKPNDMYQIKIYHHELSKDLNRLSFPDKRQANKWLKDNTDKRGYNFFDKKDISIEYQKQY